MKSIANWMNENGSYIEFKELDNGDVTVTVRDASSAFRDALGFTVSITLDGRAQASIGEQLEDQMTTGDI